MWHSVIPSKEDVEGFLWKAYGFSYHLCVWRVYYGMLHMMLGDVCGDLWSMMSCMGDLFLFRSGDVVLLRRCGNTGDVQYIVLDGNEQLGPCANWEGAFCGQAERWWDGWRVRLSNIAHSRNPWPALPAQPIRSNSVVQRRRGNHCQFTGNLSWVNTHMYIPHHDLLLQLTTTLL